MTDETYDLELYDNTSISQVKGMAVHHFNTSPNETTNSSTPTNCSKLTLGEKHVLSLKERKFSSKISASDFDLIHVDDCTELNDNLSLFQENVENNGEYLPIHCN